MKVTIVILKRRYGYLMILLLLSFYLLLCENLRLTLKDFNELMAIGDFENRVLSRYLWQSKFTIMNNQFCRPYFVYLSTKIIQITIHRERRRQSSQSYASNK